jgi:glyoxylase-like metal-dependent hydrolase (beta-lactamase superfamily II)
VARDEGSMAGTAEVHVLFEGYVGEYTASTVALVRDGDATLIIDPGMVPDRAAILDPLRQLGVDPDDVTDVVFSHHHPDHTLHAALFPAARFHDHWAVYHHDLWTDRRAEGVALCPSVRLIETPGHTPKDITILASTADRVVAFTHLWWSADGPPEDPYAQDPAALHAGRRRVLGIASLIVPGHGAAFTPTANTPR